MTNELDDLKPREIVEELDKYIIGQDKAKRAVAIALRNRMRRRKLPEDLQDEVAPKNIIMIGPTGVGKTEIARRLSRLCGAPFIKVEATKYTEVGYVGRDVESMVRDLMSVSVSMVKSELSEEVREDAEARAEEVLLDLLLPGTGKSEEKSGPVNLFTKFTAPVTGAGEGPGRSAAGASVPISQSPAVPGGTDSSESDSDGSEQKNEQKGASHTGSLTREKFRKMLREGALDDKQVEVNVSSGGGFPAIEIFSGTGMEELDVNFGGLSGLFGGRKKKKRVTVKQAKEILLNEEMDKLVDNERVSEIAKRRVEEMGIIFIDEIDKVAAKEGRTGGDVSREGVQRDILPIVEGSQVNTRYGMIDTSHILFIAAGAFHMSKPSDLIPELQGRFPIRVELDDLNADDFRLILTQPQNALIIQYVELLKTEGVELSFSDEAVTRISQIAAEVNSKTENIGARRLHTIMEMVLEEVSFTAPEITGQTVAITPRYIDDRLQDIVQDQDLSRYIL